LLLDASSHFSYIVSSSSWRSCRSGVFIVVSGSRIVVANESEQNSAPKLHGLSTVRAAVCGRPDYHSKGRRKTGRLKRSQHRVVTRS
jgi:hypothetical protein